MAWYEADLSSADKQELLGGIGGYRNEVVPMTLLLTWLPHHMRPQPMLERATHSWNRSSPD